MRSSIALALTGAAMACIVSAAPSFAGGTQLCRPTGTSPLLYTCDSGGFENSVAYSTANYSPAPTGGKNGCDYGSPSYSGVSARGAAAGSTGSTGEGGAGAAAASGPSS